MVKHHASSARWLKRQEKDPYVKQAQQSHYRSRAVYKLKEIDKKDRLFRKGQTVIDLGAAPGSWSQYASEQLGQQGKVIAIDILPMEPIDNVPDQWPLSLINWGPYRIIQGLRCDYSPPVNIPHRWLAQ